jgi:hypothetical protein
MKKYILSIMMLAGALATQAQEAPTAGFLLPRMTTAQKTAMVNPAKGLTIYNTDTNAQEINTGTAAAPVWSVVGTASSLSSKWSQDSADQISLTFPNGKDNVQYTKFGFKLNNKTNPTFDLINGTYTGYTASTRAYYNSYNEYLVKTSDISTNNTGVGTYDANNMMTIIDNSDSRVNKSTNGLRVFTSVNSDNTNSHNNVNSVGAFVSTYGTGVNTTVTSFRGGIDNAPASKITTTSFVLGGITNRQTSTLSSMRGLALNLYMENCGTVTNFLGVDASMQFKSAGNVTTMKGLNVVYSNNGANHTGTITTAYDLYASDYATGSTVTNPYGVYILGNNKVNYFEGKVGIGTTTPSKRMEIRDTNDVEFRVVRTGSAGLDLGAFANQEARISTSGAASYLTFFTNNGVGERMRITANGTVGIGTNAPSTTLTVNEVLHTTVGEKQYFSLTTDNSLNLVGGVAGNGTQITASFIRAAGSKAFYIGTTGKNEALYVTNSGNIGIGTTAPTEILQVNGAIKIGETSAATPTAGTIRFNTTTSKFEGYDGTAWVVFH